MGGRGSKSSGSPNAPAAAKPASLEAFASMVNQDAKKEDPTASPVIQRTRLIHDLWKENSHGLTLDEYKTMLTEAHKKGLVSLSRLDMQEAVTPAEHQRMQAGEIQRLGSRFHVVNQEGW